MAPALPGARGLFSVLEDSLSKADRHRVRLTQRVWDVVSDFTDIADSLRQRSTRLQELIPMAPTWVGASDACRDGMGGAWFHTTDRTQPPIVWRQAYPSDVRDNLMPSDNPKGEVSISDLELLAMIAHKDVVAQHSEVAERTLLVDGHG